MKAKVPVTYRGSLYLLNFLLSVPESTAEGITAWAITKELAAIKARTSQTNINLNASNLVCQSSTDKIPGSINNLSTH